MQVKDLDESVMQAVIGEGAVAGNETSISSMTVLTSPCTGTHAQLCPYSCQAELTRASGPQAFLAAVRASWSLRSCRCQRKYRRTALASCSVTANPASTCMRQALLTRTLPCGLQAVSAEDLASWSLRACAGSGRYRCIALPACCVATCSASTTCMGEHPLPASLLLVCGPSAQQPSGPSDPASDCAITAPLRRAALPRTQRAPI